MGSAASLAAVSATTVGYAALAGPLLGSLLGASAPEAAPVPNVEGGPVRLAATVVAITVARAVAGYVHRIVQARLGQQVVRGIREKMYAHLLRIDYETIAGQRGGALATALGSDVVQVQGLVTHDLARAASDALTLGGLVALAFALQPAMAAVAVVALPLVLAAVLAMSRRIRRSHLAMWERHEELGARVAELVSASLVIRAYAAEPKALQSFANEARDLERSALVAHRWTALGAPVVQLLAALALLGVLALAWPGLSDGTLSPEAFVSFFAAVVLLYRPVQSLGGSAEQLASALAAVDRIERILALPLEPPDPPDARSIGPLQRELRLDGVRFAYPDGEPVLRGIDLTIRRGESVAIVGLSGAGKTTLLRIVLGLLRAEGSVTLDGVPIETVARASWRAQLAWVPQEPLVLADTVLGNVALADPTPDRERARAALRAAGADELVTKLGGLDAPLAEAGRTLSGGQRQRLAIARALYRDSPILVFDEATSSLDGPSEQAIAETIERLMADRTVIVVSHRASTVERADRVVVLDGGLVVEDGAPAVLRRRGGAFAALFPGPGPVDTL
jgi:subfamily B ATP-binding cassette protein MsbA